MPSITDFTSNFQGGARVDKFRVIITYPALVTAPAQADYLFCHVAQLPESTVSPTIVFFAGRGIPFFGDRQLTPLNLTMYNDTTFAHRNAFEQWLNLMQSNQGNVQAVANYTQLLGAIQVDQLDRDDSVLKSYVFHNAFPDALSAIDLDFSATDAVESFNIGFSYQWWSSNQTS